MIILIIITIFLWSAFCVCLGMLLEMEIDTRENEKVLKENKNE